MRGHALVSRTAVLVSLSLMMMMMMLCGATSLATSLAAEDDPARDQDANPFKDSSPRPPPFVPLPVVMPWNLHEIPELPTRFNAHFNFTDGTLDSNGNPVVLTGRWVYDFKERRVLIEYKTNDVAKTGILINYQVLQQRLLMFDTAGSQAGEKCVNYDLVPPYDFLWAPNSMRDTQVYSVDFSEEDFMEKRRFGSTVHTGGASDNYIVTMHQFSNGYLREVSVGNSRWIITRFDDLSRLDNYDSDHNSAIQALSQPPPLACVYAGALTHDYVDGIQPKVPYLLNKPRNHWPSQPDVYTPPSQRKPAAKVKPAHLFQRTTNQRRNAQRRK